ncbi:MAG: SRPBCC domain-containing protein [Anaerolineaceae bacterium]|jgi:uncharacterized protein YndB with AHSA1/START domain|nr:SRPBCC domain-containing protein [Anaerolineaceae bacterium]
MLRKITADVIVPADLRQVWDTWTTEEGARTFFAPECKIELRPEGAYEMYFDLSAPEGLQGGEGCRILAIQPMEMLSFTWNAPPSMPTVRNQYTHVIVRFDANPQGTRVSISHDGWGTGNDWNEAYNYFERAWQKTVLPRLKYRFVYGPVDWQSIYHK